ncbi:MAG: putative selenium-dependent hydroxylase accessory protein YqeC [Thermoanaerobaculia bacterium]|nr:putative selenium-dependent hydroxylase accessory protein YqeC [Thermoanaerobaculia bacterium]
MSFVGAGGKTSLLLHLARELAEEGRPVLATTTTHLADPTEDVGKPLARTLLRPDFEQPATGEPCTGLEPLPGVTLLVARVANEPRKLKGIHPSRVGGLRELWGLVLVEADGSKRRPIKAPADHEPVVPEGTDVVVGVVGLDALGEPMDERTVHRPERFAAVTGCAAGAPIGWDHVVALARHPEGLFRGARGRRVVLLNKADRSPYLPSPGQVGALGADIVVLSADESGERSFFTVRRDPGR